MGYYRLQWVFVGYYGLQWVTIKFIVTHLNSSEPIVTHLTPPTVLRFLVLFSLLQETRKRETHPSRPAEDYQQNTLLGYGNTHTYLLSH